MRHRVAGRKLGRTMEHRRAMLRNMVTSLILEERIETTLPKAKELRRVADRMITLGKRGTLHARRQALSYVRTNDAVKKLFAELAGRFSERNGGYTRILKLGQRRGDAAPIAIIEYLGAPIKPPREERRRLKAEARRQAEAEAKKAKPKKKKAKAGDKAVKATPEKKTSAAKKDAAGKAAPKKKGMLGRVLKRKSQKTVKK